MGVQKFYGMRNSEWVCMSMRESVSEREHSHTQGTVASGGSVHDEKLGGVGGVHWVE